MSDQDAAASNARAAADEEAGPGTPHLAEPANHGRRAVVEPRNTCPWMATSCRQFGRLCEQQHHRPGVLKLMLVSPTPTITTSAIARRAERRHSLPCRTPPRVTTKRPRGRDVPCSRHHRPLEGTQTDGKVSPPYVPRHLTAPSPPSGQDHRKFCPEDATTATRMMVAAIAVTPTGTGPLTHRLSPGYPGDGRSRPTSSIARLIMTATNGGVAGTPRPRLHLRSAHRATAGPTTAAFVDASRDGLAWA